MNATTHPAPGLDDHAEGSAVGLHSPQPIHQRPRLEDQKDVEASLTALREEEARLAAEIGGLGGTPDEAPEETRDLILDRDEMRNHVEALRAERDELVERASAKKATEVAAESPPEARIVPGCQPMQVTEAWRLTVHRQVDRAWVPVMVDRRVGDMLQVTTNWSLVAQAYRRGDYRLVHPAQLPKPPNLTQRAIAAKRQQGAKGAA